MSTNPLDRFRLDGKVVVITGASSGLGVGFARAVAAVGGSLVLAARRLDRVQELVDELGADGTEAVGCRTDVSSEEDCADLVAVATARFGRVDVLVNYAGTTDAGSSLRQDPSAFRSVVDVNLIGTFLMARASAPVMPTGSSIVNIASVHAIAASRFPCAGYAASKAGVVGLTRDLSQQWSRRRGIRVNALCPGYFESELTADGTNSLHEMVATQSMLGRFGEQHELDSALLFLASDASSYMTGASMTVDGGFSAW